MLIMDYSYLLFWIVIDLEFLFNFELILIIFIDFVLFLVIFIEKCDELFKNVVIWFWVYLLNVFMVYYE